MPEESIRSTQKSQRLHNKFNSPFERTEELFDRNKQLESNPQQQQEQTIQIEIMMQGLIKAEQESTAKQMNRMQVALIFAFVMGGASLILAIAALLR